ncbi:hypothetical protein I6M29_11475 [Shewanella algae]|uniref:hypothetical protein n=1 Tax=Shewanella algae TaxID=38313 RepID=UPI001AAFFC3B|nr:hypothetical protein [Shewanella algae]MBO2578175.1 hypothetical protein [Shewanella algae]
MDMIELKPCPCGAEAHLIKPTSDRQSYFISNGDKYVKVACCRCSFEASHIDDWNARINQWHPLSSPPQESGRYTVHSSYGVRDAYFTTGLTQGDFRWQDCETGNDEGMQNMEGVVYKVFSWTHIPTPDTNGGDK